MPNYRLEYFKNDLISGITVAIMLIPQGMAYALIAGLPPIYGLYAALTPQIVYAFLGTSKQLAVGPVAMDSLLVAAGLGALSIVGPSQYIQMARSKSLDIEQCFLQFWINQLLKDLSLILMIQLQKHMRQL